MQRRGLHGCNLRFHPTGASPGRGERPPPGAVIHVRRGSLPGPGQGTGWLDDDQDDGSSGSNVQQLLHMNRRNPRTGAEIPILVLTRPYSVAATAVHLLHIAAHLLHCCQSTPATMRRTSPRLRPTLRVLQGGGAYLCYDCLKKAKRPAMVQSLPGVLDHRTFERTKVELGRCDVCGMGKAVYRSRSTKSSPVAGFPMGNVLHPIRTLYNDSVMFQHFAAMGDQPIQCWKQANR